MTGPKRMRPESAEADPELTVSYVVEPERRMSELSVDRPQSAVTTGRRSARGNWHNRLRIGIMGGTFDPIHAEDRYLMTVIATASNPKFTVSRVDIDRPGVTYTIDTLRDIRAQYPDAELFFITGADAVAEIMQWKDANKMWELAHFVAVTRPGYSSPDGVKLPEGKVDTLEIPALAISSTDVRRRAEHGEPVWYLVPDGVVQYIGKHGLYR